MYARACVCSDVGRSSVFFSVLSGDDWECTWVLGIWLRFSSLHNKCFILWATVLVRFLWERDRVGCATENLQVSSISTLMETVSLQLCMLGCLVQILEGISHSAPHFGWHKKYYKHSYGCIGLFYGPGDPDSGCMAGATCSLPSSHLPSPATKGICLGKVLFGSVPNNWTHCGGVVKLQIDTMYWESCGYPL